MDRCFQIQLHDLLKTAQRDNALPNVISYNRIDGPGSSLDLSEFQQTFWRLPQIPNKDDPSMEWTQNLPRTVGITINTGTKIEAHPFDPDLIGVKSIEYESEVSARPGEVVPVKENWLLKILEIFNLKGVKFVLKNLREGIHSSGLGGSSTAAIGVCILANELAGRPFNGVQLISLASRIEQGFGVSLTGTQEQSNVIFGGVRDYIWFPWGIPGHPNTGYGESLRFELIKPEDYNLLEDRIAIFHSGHPRQSSEVNVIWRNELKTKKGYKLHSQKMKIAYEFRESLRLHKWDHVISSIDKYRKIRVKLCQEYMGGSNELLEHSKSCNCTAFPLGAGGGGAVFLFSPDPQSMEKLRDDLKGIYHEIPIKILPKGHKINNITS
jgi:galactokinase/mevalonate kinase-like predicted kinase